MNIKKLEIPVIVVVGALVISFCGTSLHGQNTTQSKKTVEEIKTKLDVKQSRSESEVSAPKMTKSISPTKKDISFESLNHAQQINTLLAWIQNEKGNYVVYDKDMNNIIVVNVGQNGTNGSNDLSKAVVNSVKLSKTAGNSYTMYVLQNPNTMAQDPFNSGIWVAKATISETDLMTQYFSKSDEVVSQLNAEHANLTNPVE